MRPCKMVEFLYEAVPIGAWRAFLVRRHMDVCPACLKKLLSLDEARSLLVSPMKPEECLGLRRRLLGVREKSAPDPRAAGRMGPGWFWKWASGAAMLFALAAAGFWLLRDSGREIPVADKIGPPERFELDYIRVGGQPASAYVYQPQGTEMIIVWAEKNP
jgi:hypothetical protein